MTSARSTPLWLCAAAFLLSGCQFMCDEGTPLDKRLLVTSTDGRTFLAVRNGCGFGLKELPK